MDVEIVKAEPKEVRLGSRFSGDCFMYQDNLYIITSQVGDNRVDCIRLTSGNVLVLSIDTMITPVCAKAVVTY